MLVMRHNSETFDFLMETTGKVPIKKSRGSLSQFFIFKDLNAPEIYKLLWKNKVYCSNWSKPRSEGVISISILPTSHPAPLRRMHACAHPPTHTHARTHRHTLTHEYPYLNIYLPSIILSGDIVWGITCLIIH